MTIRYAICLLLLLIPVAASAQQTPQVIPLWPNGAPGFEGKHNEPELAKDYWVRNINNPSITVYLPPKEKATGAAVVICPGGGHRLLVFNAEGDDPARYLNSVGVAAFVLKYRLGREEGSPYKIEKHALEDGQRAMRLVRSRAKDWGLDPNRIGMMGFSAGGEVVSMVTFGPVPADQHASDPIDRANSRPDFIIMIYPGPLSIPDTVSADAPQAFMLAANDDACCSGTVAKYLRAYRDVKAQIEVHLYTKGDHGFNMGNRSKLASIKGWPQRMADWLDDSYILDPSKRPQEKNK